MKNKVLKIEQLFQEFRRYGFTGEEKDKYLIEAIERKVLAYPMITTWDIDNLNNKITTYMVSKNEKDYSQYVSYLLGSRLIKPLNLNKEIIELEVVKNLNEMENLLNEINKIKHSSMATKKVS